MYTLGYFDENPRKEDWRMKKYIAIVLFICCFFISLYTTTASGSVKLNDVLMDTVLSDEEKSAVSATDALSTSLGNLIDYQEIRSSVETAALDLYAAARRAVRTGFQRATVLFYIRIPSVLCSIYHYDVSRTFIMPPAYISQANLMIEAKRLRN